MKTAIVAKIVIGTLITITGTAAPIVYSAAKSASSNGSSDLSSFFSSLFSSSSQSLYPEMTLEGLAAYDGLNGNLAYVAVNGLVYNVTNAASWSNGTHRGMHLAGTDATVVFESSPHELTILTQLPIVGMIVSTSSSSSSGSSTSNSGTSSCSWIEIEDSEDEEDEEDDAINLPFLANGEDSEDEEDDENEYYYSCDITSSSSSNTSSTSSSGSTSTTTSSEVTPVTFTTVTLAPYDGLNGHLAYVAVHGNVYNVTNAAGWSAGSHRGMHLAGTDATAAFDASPHDLAILVQLPVVGTFVA